MKMIASADRNWAIGYKNELLTRIPSDMKFFRSKTVGKVIVMGRKTLESFPNGLPLPKRINIVLTSKENFEAKDAVIVHSLEELLEELKQYDSEQIYVVGGESIYRQLEPYCDTAYITRINHAFQADTYFPNLDQMEGWALVEESEEHTCFDLEFHFNCYRRINAK
jgi:dihydrofolate reductase